MRRIAGHLALNWIFAWALLLACIAAPDSSVGQTPSAAQVEAFRNLPPEQQQQTPETVGAQQRAVDATGDLAPSWPTSQPNAGAAAGDQVA